jgi:hypothetical protein
MVSYSLLEDEKSQKPPKVLPPVPTVKKVGPLRIRSECDYVVFAFVIGTLLLLMSDMSQTKSR